MMLLLWHPVNLSIHAYRKRTGDNRRRKSKPVAQFADLEDEEEDELDGFSLDEDDNAEAKRKPESESSSD